MEAVLALVITVVIAVLPALLFLGLWHGLNYMRDDDLVRRARDRAEVAVPRIRPRRRPGRGRGVRTAGRSTAAGWTTASSASANC